MAQFTVDTHLFRELGELLVGRDSTALVELIKNAYDADATSVIVLGEHLDDPDRGRIRISDDGVGMTRSLFQRGFLRIASRIKEEGARRSPLYQRRFTGAKGVGRLAAHKLGQYMTVVSVPHPSVANPDREGLKATIDWRMIESKETLEEVASTDAVRLLPYRNGSHEPGTKIELTALRRRWTPAERSRVIREVHSFRPPPVLVRMDGNIPAKALLFSEPRIRDVAKSSRDPGFDVHLLGDFDVGEEYWSVVAEAADWILEIEADSSSRSVRYLVTPTRNGLRGAPDAEQHSFSWDTRSLGNFPSLNARILVREGSKGIKQSQRTWLVESAGIKVYMEGFRVLPYGEPQDDWLTIDFDYSQRARALRYLDDTELNLSRFGESDRDAPLVALRNQSYYGAVFLTSTGASQLRMLVNREGFVPDAAFQALQRLVRVGVDLSVRVRAFEGQGRRASRRAARSQSASKPPERMRMRQEAEKAAKRASELASQARAAAMAGRLPQAKELMGAAVDEVERSARFTGQLAANRSIMQVLAGVGLQMSSFVHEMTGLLSMAAALEKAVAQLRSELDLDARARRKLAELQQHIGDLRRVAERQASYLTDITSPDARRRRSRQKLAERLDTSARLVRGAADKRRIEIENRIPSEIKSPPMYPAELIIIFSNLLTNAIKACGNNGRIRAAASVDDEGLVSFRMENTGKRVKLRDAEQWFLPFKSTSLEPDPNLGQGMGMGLPIVRNILEEYGATIHFVRPTRDFATALEIRFS